MQVRIPSNYRQGFQWMYGLDAGSGLLLGGGVLVLLKVITGTAPWPTKVPEALAALGIGAFFGLVKWPLERNGDRMTVWARRGLRYLRRTRRFSAFADSVRPIRRVSDRRSAPSAPETVGQKGRQ